MNFTGYFKNMIDVSCFNSPNMKSLFSALQTILWSTRVILYEHVTAELKINALKVKHKLFYLKTQCILCSKRFSPRL